MDVNCSGDSHQSDGDAVASSGERQENVRRRLVARMVAKTVDLQRQIADYQTTISSLTQRLDAASAQLYESQQQLRDSVVVVEELRSQLSAEVKRNNELKQLIESQLTSQEQANVQLAFYEEDQEYNEKLSSQTRRRNKLLQRQLNKVHDEMMQYKSLLIACQLGSRQELVKCLDELSECQTRETHLLEKFRDELAKSGRKVDDVGALVKSLVRTEEYVAVKLEMNRARQQMKSQATKAALQEVYIDELRSTVKALCQLCHRHTHHHHPAMTASSSAHC